MLKACRLRSGQLVGKRDRWSPEPSFQQEQKVETKVNAAEPRSSGPWTAPQAPIALKEAWLKRPIVTASPLSRQVLAGAAHAHKPLFLPFGQFAQAASPGQPCTPKALPFSSRGVILHTLMVNFLTHLLNIFFYQHWDLIMGHILLLIIKLFFILLLLHPIHLALSNVISCVKIIEWQIISRLLHF